VAAIATAILVFLGVTRQFHFSYALLFLSVACVFSEWLVIRLPQGNSLTTSIIFVLLALLFPAEDISPLARAVGALQAIVVGSLVGYGLTHRPPILHLVFYVAHYVWAASAAGMAFVLVSEYVPTLLITSFHLPAIAAYTVVFSLLSTLMVTRFNGRILEGDRLPMAHLLYTLFLAPIALIVYYFWVARGLSIWSLLILALPLVGVLITFRLYVNIDVTYGEVTQLYRISQEFVAAMSQEETVQRISDGIAQAISLLIARLDACLVYAHNAESNEYVLVNADREGNGPRTILPGHGLLGRIAFDGSGALMNDVTLIDALTPDERLWPPKTAILVHPMYAEGQEVGLLALVRYKKGFTAEEFRLVGIVANQAGVTLHNAQLFERSRQLADTDRQLDVLNQAAFMQRSQHILSRARSANQFVALLYPDIDDFRILNNTYGHPTGDKVLAGVADVMKEVVGETGIVGRSGGEEFFILLPGTDEQQALETADRIRARIEEHVFSADDGREVRTTISTGVAVFPRDAGDVASLVKQADRAAYLAKRMGKNRVCLYEDRKELIGSDAQRSEYAASGPPAEA
jgi:diguanylate cyclase (GGDEF)-like protein